MRFEAAIVAMRTGATIRVPALPTGNAEWFFKLVSGPGGAYVGAAERLDQPIWGIISGFGSASVLREDYEMVGEDRSEPERLMSAVTSAVFLAERSIKDAIANYAALAVAEQAIVDSPNHEVTPRHRTIAQRGVDSARRILQGLGEVWTRYG